MTREELDAIRTRAQAATRGPWEWEGPHGDLRSHAALRERLNMETGEMEPEDEPEWPDDFVEIIVTDGGHYPPYGPDRDFIAHAREDIPALLAEIDRLRMLQPPT